ncbi:MAG: hypothetical protein Q4C13_04030 [Clostridia bacterium]|nr:hypothetical protein [Clostridia bacterium]
MKKIFGIIAAVLLMATLASACTPGAVIDTLNGLGATPGNGIRLVSPGSAAIAPVSPGNAN